MVNAMYPGTFDPITYGHIDVARRAAKAFGHLVIVVMENSVKRSTLFDSEERCEMIEKVFSDDENITVDTHKGLMVEYAKKKNISVVVRGLRAVSDFEYEMQMAAANKKLHNGLDTFFLMTDTKYSFISSTLVKEIAIHGTSVGTWVPETVERELKKKCNFKTEI
ncbi:MAG TPA: pantetheine-phosphate adenylyltransferase [Thermotogota bacterium]|nr:pantetheine-phosphate adenylyltransferase [Thermotogota bacterium]HPJ90189.1 pantetheine-phosphate adenylyltransferase [Thermotogota bacterium]HPR95559.1 pantetheine-phosphate adenylyltransferase [Thermotogota bacterium]